MENTLLVYYMDVNAKEATTCDVDDVIEVKVDSKAFLKSFSKFYDNGVIMYFTGKVS